MHFQRIAINEIGFAKQPQDDYLHCSIEENNYSYFASTHSPKNVSFVATSSARKEPNTLLTH